MGLLDWLTSDLGGLGGGGGMMPPGLSDGGMAPQGPGDLAPPGMSMPPVQPTGEDTNVPNFNFGQMALRPPEAEGMPAPPAAGMMPPPNPMNDGMSLPPGLGRPPMPAGTDPMTAGGPMPNGPGLPPPPLPQPRPVEAAGPAAPPPNAAPTGGRGMPPAPPMDQARGEEIVRSYERAGGSASTPPNGGSQAQTALGRALGLDGNKESQIRGSLAAGFKAAGDSAGKSPGQAFSSGVGASLEGGKKADDKTTEQQDKYLQRAIAAKREGNQAEYQKNYLRYQIEATKAKLEASKEKAAGKDSVMNSPEQLYLRAIGATNQDGGLKILANKVREAQKLGPDSKEAKAAQAEYDAQFKVVRDQHLGTLGVDPSKIKGLESKPGFSDKNPVKDFPKDPAAAQKAFDALPPGAYFVNPKDGRLLRKKDAAGPQGANPAQPQQASALQPPMPMDPNDPLNQEAA
jgi:hypothetical protein